MAKEKICGIYCIENLIDGKKYIGLSRDIKTRWKQHKNKLNLGKHINKHLQSAWIKYGESNFNFYVLEVCPEGFLYDKEILYIDKYNTQNKEFGYNQTSGGDGTKDVDDNIKDNISLHETLYPVIKLSLDGEYICEYRNCNYAAQDMHGNKKNIYRCCKYPYKYKTAYNFIWVFKKDYNPSTFDIYFYTNCKSTRRRKILQYDIQMNLISEYCNMGDAERATGISRKLISKVCNGNRKQTHGYIFKFKI